MHMLIGKSNRSSFFFIFLAKKEVLTLMRELQVTGENKRCNILLFQWKDVITLNRKNLCRSINLKIIEKLSTNTKHYHNTSRCIQIITCMELYQFHQGKPTQIHSPSSVLKLEPASNRYSLGQQHDKQSKLGPQ